uniref:PGG domain-containing protein n=1 Tax=Manihot esculenta TaxID=3983 RepID=A0A199U9M7_MANES
MKYLRYDVEEIRGALMIVATVIATMTFQAAMNPLSGVWQQNFANKSSSFGCNDTNVCKAGTAVLAYAYPEAYIYYSTFNGTVFVLSLSVITLVVGEFPL